MTTFCAALDPMFVTFKENVTVSPGCTEGVDVVFWICRSAFGFCAVGTHCTVTELVLFAKFVSLVDVLTVAVFV